MFFFVFAPTFFVQVSAFYNAEERRRNSTSGIESGSAPFGSSGRFGDPGTRTLSLGQAYKPTTRTPSITSAGEIHGDEPDKVCFVKRKRRDGACQCSEASWEFRAETLY